LRTDVERALSRLVQRTATAVDGGAGDPRRDGGPATGRTGRDG